MFQGLPKSGGESNGSTGWMARFRFFGTGRAASGSRRTTVFRHFTSSAVLLAVVLGLTGCLLETETAITPDPVFDSRLEGVWRIVEERPGEQQDAREVSDFGVNGYIIIAPLENPNGSLDEKTCKAIAIDRFERDTASRFPDMFISTRKHKGHNLLLVRLADYEKENDEFGELNIKNWVLDYKFNEKGELLLGFWSIDDLDKLQKAHPMKVEHEHKPFAPAILNGDEEQLLEFHSDPKVRNLLTSMGRYQKLEEPEP